MISYRRLGRTNLQVSEIAFGGGDTEQRRARAALKAVGDRYGTRAQTALRFALANRDLACIILGMAEREHLEQAIAAAAAGALPPDAVARLEPVYESGFEL